MADPTEKHTPGPWFRRGADTYRWQVEAGENPKKAIVVARVTTPKGGAAVSDANGALIASAPELLAALEVADAHLATIYTQPNPVRVMMRAAINKAKGITK